MPLSSVAIKTAVGMDTLTPGVHQLNAVVLRVKECPEEGFPVSEDV